MVTIEVIRLSPFTGRINVMRVRVEQAGIDAYNRGERVQDAFPGLTPDEREFILTGTTPEDWEATYGNRESPYEGDGG